jgi:hypothetical protein
MVTSTKVVAKVIDAGIAMVSNGTSKSKCIVSWAMDIDACKYSSKIFKVNQCTANPKSNYTFGQNI